MGTVPKVLDLKRQVPLRPGEYGALKLTMQQFYRVNGESTQNRGVRSDVVLPSRTDHDDFGESSLDYALDFSQIGPADYQTVPMVDNALVTQLRDESGQRMQKDPELVKLIAQKSKFDERKGRKILVFNEASLRLERAEIEDEKKENEQEGAEEEQSLLSSKKVEKFGQDPYSKEVLQIAIDLIRLKDQRVVERTR
jgi:carboxyl-terminal processing protease